ncbi:MAG TPA: Asp23/Gls24 family envelope stress response protein [Pseudonocardia sp.]|jgi:hypothetical protein|nr:Asp23/Gls24 family envelope stress response protein [Pseudonocardia sp.]
MAIEPTRTGHALPCGRTVEDVLEELDSAGPSLHTLDCPHCSTARAGIEALETATAELLVDPTEPPPGLLDRIMSAVGAEVGRGAALPLATGGGPADISIRAVASLLRYVADTVPGARARHCAVQPEPGRPGEVRVEMTLAVRYGSIIEDVVAQVRGSVASALAGRIGLRSSLIVLDVVDVLDPEAP